MLLEYSDSMLLEYPELLEYWVELLEYPELVLLEYPDWSYCSIRS